MRCSEMVTGVLLGLLPAGLVHAATGQGGARRSGTEQGPSHGPAACRSAVMEAEVRAGQDWRRSFAGGLDVVLEPRATGWLLRVLPSAGPRPREDYAEIATPPYRSVSPLLVSTDFGFRAQDAVGWNPRRFRYAADARAFGRLEGVYRRVTGAKGGRASAADEAELGKLVSEQPGGEMEIVDASLAPGTGDPTRAAELLATHFAETAHRIEQPGAGGATALGRIGGLRVRLRLELPRGMHAVPGVNTMNTVCGGG